MLFATDVLAHHRGAQVVFDVKCSSELGRVVRDHGGTPVLWKTGHSLIKAKVRETGARLGGELAGHFVFADRWFPFDDALYAGARLLEILAADSRRSAQIFATLPDAANTPELSVPLSEGEAPRLMARFAREARFPGARVTRLDGVRADFDDGWGLVRASHTTPSLVLRFEGRDAEALDRIEELFRRELHKVDPGLALPF